MNDDPAEIRRRNLRLLADDYGNKTQLAIALGHSNASFLSQIIGPNPRREISEKQARKVEKKLKLPSGWLDATRVANKAGSARGLPESAGGAGRSPVALNDIDDQVIRRVLAAVHDLDPQPSAERVADTIRVVYEHARAVGRVEDDYIATVLKLIR